MSYQSEAVLENLFIEQLQNQNYEVVEVPDYETLEENFKIQFSKFNADKLEEPLSEKEWGRVFNYLKGKSVFQSAKILRDKFILERDNGTKIYLSLINPDHTKIFFR